MKIVSPKTAVCGFFAVAYAGFTAVSYRLYLRQAIHYPGRLGAYESDLPAHIHEGRAGTGYSLMEKSFGFLMNTLKTNEKAVALWLAFLTVATVWVTYLIMKNLFPEGNKTILHLLAFAAMFWMPIYLPQLNPHRYLGLQSGSVWHNSTYLGMRFAAMLLLLFYFRYQDTYMERFRAKEFMWFTVLLVFANLMKPNFILCFAPAMALMLLTDCIGQKGKKLKQQILFGIPVLISLAVVAYETLVLFAGENGGSSILIDFAFSLKLRTEHPAIALLQSSIFPLVVLLGNWKDLKTDRRFRVCWLTWLTALVEYLLLCEDGPRKYHGNFSWGYCFALFLVFVISVVWFYQNIKAFMEDYNKQAGKNTLLPGMIQYVQKGTFSVKVRSAYLVLALVLLLLFLYFGAEFAWIIFNGGSYAA